MQLSIRPDKLSGTGSETITALNGSEIVNAVTIETNAPAPEPEEPDPTIEATEATHNQGVQMLKLGLKVILLVS